MQSCIALYDLKVERQYFKKGQANHNPFFHTMPIVTRFFQKQYFKNKGTRYNDYFYEKRLEDGLTIKIRADGYYVFDFGDSSFAPSAEINNEGIIDGHLNIHNKRIEVIHAFLACLRYATQKESRCYHVFDMKFIDNYITCSRNGFDLDQLLQRNDLNAFSSDEYMQLCAQKLHRVSNTHPDHEIDNISAIDQAVIILDKVMSSKYQGAGYILGIMYRAAVYHNMGLEIHSVTFLRSIFEWLSRSSFPTETDKGKRYRALLDSHGYCEESREDKLLATLRDLRHEALHELKFPQDHFLKNPVGKCFKLIERMLCAFLDIKLSIPLGRQQFCITEDR